MFGRGDRRYPIPKTLEKLKEINRQVSSDLGVELDDILHVYIDYDLSNQDPEFAYNGHPLDVIPFALTAIGGEHFGFLTDFGSIDDLEDAPIVFVQALPFEEYHVTLLANNIIDFLGLFLSYRDLTSLFFLDDEPDIDDNTDPSEDPHLLYVKEKLIEGLGISAKDPQKYRKDMLEKRSKEVALQTINGIGIKRISSEELGPVYSIDLDVDYRELINEVQRYFREASVENKLACIVDLQETGVMTNRTEELNEYIIKELSILGFHYESKMLELTTKNYE
ncbi:hypothetical protein [Paenibacillus lactis]|uniref:Uncharacterized protein n=2 Tax=Paenibacillus lactis TaxID=228574 RepID=G4H9H8_9BACL|nr:hypothetical protein [Paenibacillus lactis]EHB68513.1 hypothetical protein PaelaDRAFT_0639 [Paenibacillus lactis 154]MBP1893460.1 hypothetical protein [Paenibacillus lactis]MCM3496913.1 hypothetical protein [Paenibacillus lactis]